jgi:N-acetylmuramoyl-L-alanine amidase
MVKVRRALFACMLAGATLAAGAEAQAPGRQAAHAQAILVAETAGAVYVTVELSAPVTRRAFVLEGDRPRFVLDLTGARWRPRGLPPGAGAGPGAGFAERFRYADHETGLSRLVLDLSAPGVVGEVREEALAGGGVRLIASVRPATPAVAAPPRALAQTAPTVLATALQDLRPSRRVIVVDAGHGGRDPGASGVSGSREKDMTLDAALRLRDLLEATGRYHVVLTRDADVFLPLPERLGMARDNQADLFISVHADASDNPAVHGAAVYTISERGAARGRHLAETQNWSLTSGEPVRSETVEDILLDLSQRETTHLSASFAQTLIGELAHVTPLLRNTHREAGFFVLLAPDVPAILLELGFLTNAEDEARLSDPRHRQRLMLAVAEAIDAHFASRPARMVLAQH